MSAELKRTPLYEAHKALGARLVPFAGFSMPVQYEGIVKEHTAVRERVGLFDVSHMGELFLRGPEALALADHLVTNAVSDLTVGRALYTVCVNAEGTILDDLRLVAPRISREEAWRLLERVGLCQVLRQRHQGLDADTASVVALSSLRPAARPAPAMLPADTRRVS